MRQLRSLVRRARDVLSSIAPPPDVRDDAARERFEIDGLARCRQGARFFCWFAIALLGLSALNSYAEGPGVFHTVVRVRLAAIGMLAVVLFLLGSPLGRRRPRELTLLFVLVMGVTFHALALAVPSEASEQYDRMAPSVGSRPGGRRRSRDDTIV